MSLLVADCPRCGAKTMTFDVKSQVYRFSQYGWQNWYETFCLCRACDRPNLSRLANRRWSPTGYGGNYFINRAGLFTYPDALNPYFSIDRYISLRDNTAEKSPEHLSEEIENAFNEGAACLSIGCNNAAATMFRLCVDLRPGHCFLTRPTLASRNPIAGPAVISVFALRGCLTTTPCRRLYENFAKCIREMPMTARTLGISGKEDAEAARFHHSTSGAPNH